MKHILLVLTVLIISLEVSFAQSPLPGDDDDLNFIEAFALDLFAPKHVRQERRNLRRLLKEFNTEKLEEFIHRIENGEPPEKIAALRNTPFMLYLLLALYYDCEKNNDDKAAIYYTVAHRWDQGRSKAISDNEKLLARKFIKHYKKNKQMNCLREGNKPYQILAGHQMRGFVASKSKNYLVEKYPSEKVDSLLRISNSITEVLSILRAERARVISEIDSLTNLMDAKQASIKGLTQDNHEKALQDLQKFKSKNGDDIVSSKANITQGLAGGATLVLQNAIPTEVITNQVDQTGQNLGDYCSDKIKSATSNIVKALMDLIDFEAKTQGLTEQDKSRIKIKLTLTGKADGNKVVRKADGTCSLIYRDKEPIRATYYSVSDKKEKSAAFKQGDPICDEELAFLRGVCADRQIRNVFRQFRFNNANIETTFNAVLYTEKGDKFRGVDIDLDVENLFLFYVDRIHDLRIQKEDLERQIANKEAEKATIDSEISSTNSNRKLFEDQVSVLLKGIQDHQSN